MKFLPGGGCSFHLHLGWSRGLSSGGVRISCLWNLTIKVWVHLKIIFHCHENSLNSGHNSFPIRFHFNDFLHEHLWRLSARWPGVPAGFPLCVSFAVYDLQLFQSSSKFLKSAMHLWKCGIAGDVEGDGVGECREGVTVDLQVNT